MAETVCLFDDLKTCPLEVAMILKADFRCCVACGLIKLAEARKGL